MKSSDQAKMLGRCVVFGFLVALLVGCADNATTATTGSDPVARASAVKQLTDQGVIATVAMTDADPDVRMAAISVLTDQGALGKIASSDPKYNDISVIKAAQTRLGVLNPASTMPSK